MRIIATILLMGILGITVNGQISTKNVEKIKKSKIIIAQYNNEEISKHLKEAVDEYWNFAKVEGTMPLDEAIDKAKSDDAYLVLKLGTKNSKSSLRNATGGWNYRYISTGKTIEISNGKKALAGLNIPAYHNEEYSKEIFVFGISALQMHLHTMDEKKVGMTKLNPIYKKEAPKLSEKTLLIPEGWADEKLTQDILNGLYPYKAKIVSYEEWRKAILERQEDKAYVMISPMPVDGNYVYQHFLMDCKDARIYAISQSKINVKFDLKNIKEVNLSKGNSGYVKEKNVKLYSKIVVK